MTSDLKRDGVYVLVLTQADRGTLGETSAARWREPRGTARKHHQVHVVGGQHSGTSLSPAVYRFQFDQSTAWPLAASVSDRSMTTTN